MINPDHIDGGIRGAGLALFGAAGLTLLIGTFAGAQIAQFAGLAIEEAPRLVARMSAAYAAVLALGGALVLFIGAQPYTRWLTIAFVSFVVFASCLITLAFFASPATYVYGWWLLGGMIGGIMVCSFATKHADRLAHQN